MTGQSLHATSKNNCLIIMKDDGMSHRVWAHHILDYCNRGIKVLIINPMSNPKQMITGEGDTTSLSSWGLLNNVNTRIQNLSSTCFKSAIDEIRFSNEEVIFWNLPVYELEDYCPSMLLQFTNNKINWFTAYNSSGVCNAFSRIAESLNVVRTEGIDLDNNNDDWTIKTISSTETVPLTYFINPTPQRNVHENRTGRKFNWFHELSAPSKRFLRPKSQ